MARFSRLFVLSFSIAFGCITFRAGAQTKLDDAVKTSIINEAARLLDANYVHPDVGKKCGDHIKSRMAAGEFSEISDHESFAQALTKELQSISNDKHMRVRMDQRQLSTNASPDPIVESFRRTRQMASGNFGLPKAEIMTGNVGYLEITGFPPVELARPSVEAAMAFLQNVDVLIFDLRRNGGGNPTSIQLICSYLFAERTHLNSIYWRRGDRTEEFWTLDTVHGKRRPDLSVFVLTSKRTFSGGEEFAYNLKTRKRATLIGETTGGGANPGGVFPLGSGMGIFVPTGRAINPVTGTNWEGTGVEPDIEVEADGALDIALEKAQVVAEERRKAFEARTAAALGEMHKRLEDAEKFHASGDTVAAMTTISAALQPVRATGLVGEVDINALGYRYMAGKKYPLAIAVFRYNTEVYPHSWNVYDSLGEAYLASGDTQNAIVYYKKSLSLNPENSGAREALMKLGVK